MDALGGPVGVVVAARTVRTVMEQGKPVVARRPWLVALDAQPVRVRGGCHRWRMGPYYQ